MDKVYKKGGSQIVKPFRAVRIGIPQNEKSDCEHNYATPTQEPNESQPLQSHSPIVVIVAHSTPFVIWSSIRSGWYVVFLRSGSVQRSQITPFSSRSCCGFVLWCIVLSGFSQSQFEAYNYDSLMKDYQVEVPNQIKYFHTEDECGGFMYSILHRLQTSKNAAKYELKFTKF